MRFLPTYFGITFNPSMSSFGADVSLSSSDGKFSSIKSSFRTAVNSPLFVKNLASLFNGNIAVSHKTWALARVACPQRPTSLLGLNHLRLKPSSRLIKKAVSDKFISPATLCIHASSFGKGSMHTAAGLPENILSVKAST